MIENTNLELKPVEIRENQYMSDLYPDGLPSNAIIDKTLTAKGATTCELDERYAKRNSIIIEPNVPVIDSKQVKYPNLLGVREGVTDYDVKKYLLDKSIRYKKIIVTPESYSKVKQAAEYAGVNLFKDFFLLIDECEKVVQEANFRPAIVQPFFDFFSFDNKALISATPLSPKLKGFTKHSFSHIKIVPTYDYKKNLSLIGTNNVQLEFLKQISLNDNKKAIFLNSPEYAKTLIEKADIRNHSKIYCSNQENAINKLHEDGYKASDSFVSGEILEQYSFFTSRFYSAVDLDTPDKPDIIMVTDCLNKQQTMIDPFTHSVQITGRFRSGIGNITHITNWKEINLYSKKSVERFKIFIGFRNRVCSNLMLTTDGLQDKVEVLSVQELYAAALNLFHAYNPSKDLHLLRTLGQMSISTSEFCQIIGRMRLYQALTPNQQKRLPRLLLGDSQINAACRAFVSDVNFKSTGDSITGWQLLNLLNGSVKSSYIDNFLERNLNCTEFVQGIQRAKLGDSEYAWFLG